MTHRLMAGLLALTAVVCAQRKVDPRQTYVRLIYVAPITGEGTKASPKRPQYVPQALAAGPSVAINTSSAVAPTPPSQQPASTAAPAPTDILAFTQQMSDDGQYALVELVAPSAAAFQTILNDKSIKVAFILGSTKKDDIEKQLKQYKKNFNLDSLAGVMP